MRNQLIALAFALTSTAFAAEPPELLRNCGEALIADALHLLQSARDQRKAVEISFLEGDSDIPGVTPDVVKRLYFVGPTEAWAGEKPGTFVVNPVLKLRDPYLAGTEIPLQSASIIAGGITLHSLDDVGRIVFTAQAELSKKLGQSVRLTFTDDKKERLEVVGTPIQIGLEADILASRQAAAPVLASAAGPIAKRMVLRFITDAGADLDIPLYRIDAASVAVVFDEAKAARQELVLFFGKLWASLLKEAKPVDGRSDAMDVTFLKGERVRVTSQPAAHMDSDQKSALFQFTEDGGSQVFLRSWMGSAEVSDDMIGRADGKELEPTIQYRLYRPGDEAWTVTPDRMMEPLFGGLAIAEPGSRREPFSFLLGIVGPDGAIQKTEASAAQWLFNWGDQLPAMLHFFERGLVEYRRPKK